MKCNFIGIGVQKSASTWIYRVLEDHPEVCVSVPKELDYFSNNYDLGHDWYESHFQAPDSLQKISAVGEISPSYFDSDESAQRAYDYNPDLKVIVTLRDPVERAYSNHLHLIRIGQYKGETMAFEDGLKAHPEYLSQSFYARHLKSWFDVFSADHVLVLLQEDIKIEPELQAKKLYNFLDIDPEHKSNFLFRKANISFQEKFKGLEAVLKFFAKISRKAGLAGIVDIIKRLPLVVKLREKNRKHLNNVIPPVSEKVEDELYEIFRKDTLELAEFLGRSELPWKTWLKAGVKSSKDETV